MNERIKELATQAGLIAPYGSDHEGLRDFDYRKFAELIVNDVEEELKDLAQWYSNNENYVAENTCYNFINHLNRMFKNQK